MGDEDSECNFLHLSWVLVCWHSDFGKNVFVTVIDMTKNQPIDFLSRPFLQIIQIQTYEDTIFIIQG